MVEERRPRAGHHSMAWRGAAHMTLLWLRLPLASNGRDVDVILGYDAVLAPRGDMSSAASAAALGRRRLARAASRRMRSTIENRPLERWAEIAPVRPSWSKAALASKASISAGVRPE